MEILIELAQTSDIPAIQAVAAASWHATYADIFTPAFIERFLAGAYSTDALQHSIANERSIFLVAKAEDQVIGYGQAGVGLRTQGDGFELYRLYVAPTHWRQGIGACLLSKIEHWLKVQGATGYGCHVHSQNEVGKAFYRKAGFVHKQVHDHDDEWYMEKELLA